ncbi:MAG: D-alanyl-D-alanine carboxypeptidase/D-alanyl-D-alanine-endopeptidase, partial [Limnothrix sp.]
MANFRAGKQMMMASLKSRQLYSAIALGFLTIGFLPQASFAQPTINQAANQCDLSGAIAAITNRPEHQKAHWGIAVQDVASDQIIYQNNADKFFVPASNLKLLTTAIALETLGKDYRFQTEIYTIGDAPQLDALILKGSGQPTLTSALIETALEQLKANGVTNIKEVIIDDSYFTELAVNPTWEWSDLPAYYAVPVNSFILDQNVVTLTLLPAEIGQPAEVKWSDNIAASQWELDNQLITAAAETPYQGRLSQQYGTTKLQLKG